MNKETKNARITQTTGNKRQRIEDQFEHLATEAQQLPETITDPNSVIVFSKMIAILKKNVSRNHHTPTKIPD